MYATEKTSRSDRYLGVYESQAIFYFFGNYCHASSIFNNRENELVEYITLKVCFDFVVFSLSVFTHSA